MSALAFNGDDRDYKIQPAIPQAVWPIEIGRSYSARNEVKSFLDLPAELRNAIYELALAFSDPFMVVAASLYRYRGSDNQGLIPTKGAHESRQYGTIESIGIQFDHPF